MGGTRESTRVHGDSWAVTTRQTCYEHGISTTFDGSHCLVDVERVAADVARIDHLLGGERFGVEVRVILPQQLGAHPDRLGAKPRSRPVGGSGVERHSDDGDIVARHLVESGQPGKRLRTRKAGKTLRSAGPRLWLDVVNCSNTARGPPFEDSEVKYPIDR